MSVKGDALAALAMLELRLDAVAFAMADLDEAVGEAELAFTDLADLVDDIEEVDD